MTPPRPPPMQLQGPAFQPPPPPPAVPVQLPEPPRPPAPRAPPAAGAEEEAERQVDKAAEWLAGKDNRLGGCLQSWRLEQGQLLVREVLRGPTFCRETSKAPAVRGQQWLGPSVRLLARRLGEKRQTSLSRQLFMLLLDVCAHVVGSHVVHALDSPMGSCMSVLWAFA